MTKVRAAGNTDIYSEEKGKSTGCKELAGSVLKVLESQLILIGRV